MGRSYSLDLRRRVVSRVEGGPIHWTFEQRWGRQPMARQSGNEGLALPVAERGRTGQPLALHGPTSQPGQLGGCRRLVDEGEPMRHGAHDRLALMDPDVAKLGDVRACALLGQQRFFYR